MISEKEQNEFIGKRIKELRLENKMTQTELARKLDYKSTGILSHIEKGEKKPSYEKLRQFAEIFNCDVAYLLGDSNIKNIQSYKKDTEYVLEKLKDAGLIIDDKLDSKSFEKAVEIIKKIKELDDEL